MERASGDLSVVVERSIDLLIGDRKEAARQDEIGLSRNRPPKRAQHG